MICSNVNDVARYVIYSAFKQNCPVSNLKLQKLLYFFWKDFYKEKNRVLFTEEFRAWKFGPVQVDVYFDYYIYGATEIDDIDYTHYTAEELDDETKKFLDAEVRDFSNATIYELVTASHKEGSAWARIYGDGEGNKDKIPFEYIKEDIANGI